MVPWIQVYSNIITHDKTYSLAELLKIPNYSAVGLMVSLWCWASVNAPDGDITSYPPRAISAAAGWQKSPAVFYEALQETRLIERAFNEKIMLRNWERYAGLLIDMMDNQKKRTSERVKRYREKNQPTQKKPSYEAGFPKEQSEVETLQERYSNVTETLCNASTVPNLTVPNLSPKGESTGACATPNVKPFASDPLNLAKEMGKVAPKKSYGEFGLVKLTVEEYEQLAQRLGKGEAESYITRLDGYLASSGKRYKNHYATLLGWHRKDGEKGVTPPGQGYGGKAKDSFAGASYALGELEMRLLKAQLEGR